MVALGGLMRWRLSNADLPRNGALSAPPLPSVPGFVLSHPAQTRRPRSKAPSGFLADPLAGCRVVINRTRFRSFLQDQVQGPFSLRSDPTTCVGHDWIKPPGIRVSGLVQDFVGTGLDRISERLAAGFELPRGSFAGVPVGNRELSGLAVVHTIDERELDLPLGRLLLRSSVDLLPYLEEVPNDLRVLHEALEVRSDVVAVVRGTTHPLCDFLLLQGCYWEP